MKQGTRYTATATKMLGASGTLVEVLPYAENAVGVAKTLRRPYRMWNTSNAIDEKDRSQSTPQGSFAAR